MTGMVYTVPVWVPGAALGVAVVLVMLAAVAQSTLRILPLSVAMLAPPACCVGVVAPSLATDQVVLDDDKLEQTVGLWFAPSVKGFRHDSVARIAIRTGVNERNLRSVGWVVEHKDGTTEVIDPGDLWELHTDDIVARLRARGIEVVVD